MLKKFIGWIFAKIYIDTRERVATLNQGEVYWCRLGENIGHEQNGKGEYFRRPVLVFKKFNNSIFWGIPMSTKHKESIYYVKVLLKNVNQSALISQLRLLDSKRLDEKIGYISQTDLKRVQEAIISVINN